MRRLVHCGTFLAMRRSQAIVRAVQEHPFASDAALGALLLVLVLSDLFTSGDYFTGSDWAPTSASSAGASAS